MSGNSIKMQIAPGLAVSEGLGGCTGMVTWLSTPPGKEASMGWLQGASTPDPAVAGPKRRDTALLSDFMLQCIGTPRAPAVRMKFVVKRTQDS